MTTLSTDDPVAVAVVKAIRSGDVATVQRLLGEHPDLATARLGDDEPGGMSRTLLHVATDWPGHFPNGATTVVLLVGAGADVNARFRGPHAARSGAHDVITWLHAHSAKTASELRGD